jgi:hypothetical protein
VHPNFCCEQPMPLSNRALDLLVKVGRFLSRGTRFQRFQWVNSMYASYQTLDLRGPILVKVDVEGFEPEVLAGATKFIRELRPLMQ